MDKEKFLQELGAYLVVLNEKEQKDILDEYAQHIDLKMKDGMSEEEAIDDFGDIKELAADILEAYHVKLPFEKQESNNSRTEQGFVKIQSFITNCIKKPVRWLVNVLKKPAKLFKRLRTAGNHPVYERKGGFFKNLFHCFTKMCKGIKNLCIRCLIWFRNLILIGVFLFVAICTILNLFGFGVLIVLLAAGYPLIGVTLACFGSLLCVSALTVCCMYMTGKALGWTGKEKMNHA